MLRQEGLASERFPLLRLDAPSLTWPMELGERNTEKFVRLFLLPGVGHCGGGEGLNQIDLLSPLMEWTEQHKAPDVLISGKLASDTHEKVAMPPMQPQGTMSEGKMKAESLFHGLQLTSSPVAAAMPLLYVLLTAVVQGFRFSSLANFRVSCAVYAEPLSFSHCIGVSGNLSPKRFSTDLSITSCTLELS
ncbi:hypothetical protein STN0717ENT73_P20270 (plasmid) [Enterobacter cloacae]|jgi:hypothetical protein|nr:hypothetical protein P852_04688 [Enterobacter asburiae]KSX07731.1 hypothetical protein APT79_10850 [Enterobacter sp. K66-74]BBW48547.1 hypothetical protein STN0717ENT73_P20270 [Enterobacter cloacae]